MANGWNEGVELFDALFRAYVDQVVAGIRANGIVVSVFWDPEAELYNTPDIAHLVTAWDEEILTKWNYDNWPVSTAVRELTNRFRASEGQPPLPAEPRPKPGPGGQPSPKPAGEDGGVAFVPQSPNAPGFTNIIIPQQPTGLPASWGTVIAAVSAPPPYPAELTGPPYYVVPPPAIPVVKIIITTILGALWKLFGGGVSTAIKRAFEGIRSALAQTADELLRFSWRIARAARWAFSALHALYVRIVRPALDWIRNLADRIARLIDRILRPYYEWLRTMRRILLDLYERYVRPVLVVIQTMRRILAVLSLLRIGFARKLDARLARLEGKILAPLRVALQRVHHMGGWINLLITARYLLQRAVLLNSLYAMQGAWVKMWYNAQAPGSDPHADAVLRTIPQPMPEPLATQGLRDYVTARGGVFAVDVEAAAGDLRAGLGLG